MELVLAIAVIVSTIFLSMDYHEIENNSDLYNFLQISNKVMAHVINLNNEFIHFMERKVYFQVLAHSFELECVLKLIATGPKAFFKQKINLFDFSLVILFFVDCQLEETKATAMNVLHGLRTLSKLLNFV